MGKSTLPLSVAVLGGDQRQVAMATALAHYGMKVYTWGLPRESGVSEGQIPCFDWKQAVDAAKVVILPLPATLDGVRLFCKTNGDDAGLRLDTLFSALNGKQLLGGRLNEAFWRMAESGGISCADYYASELLQLKNALPSAEGAISIAMQELPVTMDGVHAAVLGYGRIGSLLAQKLRALGASVSVFARREEALTLASLAHCETYLLTEKADAFGLLQMPREVRVIFNTIPQCLLTDEVLRSFPKERLLIDLASAPGGVDRTAAAALGFRCIWATALPGKYAPETAGVMIAQTIRSLLREKKLL